MAQAFQDYLEPKHSGIVPSDLASVVLFVARTETEMVCNHNLFVVLAPLLLGHVTANQCASPLVDGTCGEDGNVLIQSRLAVDSVDVDSAEQLSFSEEALQKRYESRVRLVLQYPIPNAIQ